MLENICFFDSHFHLKDFLEISGKNIDEIQGIGGCISCHSEDDFNILQEKKGFIKSFGIHPQNPEKSWLDYLENLAKSGMIKAVGEFGFDFYTPELKKIKDIQKEIFENQLEIALSNSLPVVIHCRKANEILFSYSRELSLLPGVQFHSFMGSFVEAESFIRKGINCCFSFGKQIFNNNKKVLELVLKLPSNNLLFETDAPYQKLKNEDYTSPLEIKKIYEEGFRIKKENLSESKLIEQDFMSFCETINRNFSNLYGID